MNHPELKLHVFHGLPEGLLEHDATQLHAVLPGPSLIEIDGVHQDALFVSVLLHGNESTGWDALRELLKKSQGKKLPRRLLVFIGNISAAQHRLRVLDGQPDYNRIWKLDGEGAEYDMARELIQHLREQNLFAAIDIHNNTGLNPHYACINRLDNAFMHLATLFSRTVVYFLRPDSVMSRAMAQLCPAVTIECGKADDARGVMHALQFVEACLHLDHFPHHAVAQHDIDLFHTVAVIKIPDHLEFGFNQDDVHVNLIEDIDRLNFTELPAGTVLGEVQCDESVCLHAINEQGEDIAQRYFANHDGQLVLTTALMPSMLTLDKSIIRQDCLCYMMERLDYRAK